MSATPRAASSLAKTLASLTKSPRPVVPAIKELSLTLAQRNAHFGARHFLKEELPRIAYANPAIKIAVERRPKTAEEQWDPEIKALLDNGTTKTINMHMKHSTAILRELLAVGGWTPAETTETTASKQANELPS
ncbi:hypothetical protein BOTBODRAFT_105474 [Botryobasidium botryosum FD-172 SS1]|uniref:Ribosomal protein/NADH dehydrogenase domain-containing protein n=1 Tax=Botryobasidium botryosum (strain FD-172 SS1) TaxID=930990 RepID=A0A067MPP2_BOTB1|nr:hypothetical protein BOTBODRAFT_105474 [Botryobasidium botryosum FD-172 SS1]